MDAMTKRIKIDLVEGRGIRLSCHVCGGCTEKGDVLAEGRDDDGDTIRVCETCLKAGDIDARLEQHAKNLVLGACAYAEEIRALIGRLQVPTYQEYQDKIKQLEYEYEIEQLMMMDAYENNENDTGPSQVRPSIQHGDEFNEAKYFADPHRF
jgi:aconitase B